MDAVLMADCTGGADALVQPWVWILWIAVSPLLQLFGDQMYMHLNVSDAHMCITCLHNRHVCRRAQPCTWRPYLRRLCTAILYTQ
jgi:hypothetical protein